MGISGTPNFWGSLRVEPNPRLRHQLAFGRPGVAEWGEWEKIRRTDPAVAMALDFVVGPLRDAVPGVEEADDSPLAKAQADFVRHTLFEALAPTWAGLVDELARGSLASGFALHELVWRDVRHAALPGGGGYGLAEVAQRLPSSLPETCWLEDDSARLQGIRQQGPRGANSRWVDVVLPASKVLLTSWQREGGNYQGFSQFRPVYYACRVRDEVGKIPGIALAREGAGIPVAYADSPDAELSPEEREKLEETLRNLVFHESAHMVMKPGWKLEWLFSGGANKSHIVEVLNHFGMEILSTCHAQQMMLGVNETGSRAVGSVHDARAKAFIESVKANLLNVINGVGDVPGTGLVRRLVDANWGPQEKYPKVTLALQPSELDPSALTTAIATSKTAGVLTWRVDDENALRKRLGFEPIKPEEFAAAKAPPPVSPPPAKAPPFQEPDADAGATPPQPPLKQTGFMPARKLRASELVLNLDRMASFLDGAKEEFERKAKPLLVAALAEAAPLIKEAMADGNPDEVASMPLRLEAFEAYVRRYLADAAREGAAEVRAELSKGAPAQAVRNAEPEDEDPAAKLIEATAKSLVRRVRNRLTQQLEEEAIDVVRLDGDAIDVVTRVTTRALEGRQLQTDAGAVLTRAWNGGRDFAAKQLGGVKEVELSAALDSNTCMACNALDGTRFPFESEEHNAHVPPLRECAGGPLCRCVLVYVPADSSDDRGDE